MIDCPICIKRFGNISKLMMHIKIYHNFVSTFPCKQLHCSRQFHTPFGFKRHLSLKHKNEEVAMAVDNKVNDYLNEHEVVFNNSTEKENMFQGNTEKDIFSSVNMHDEFVSALSKSALTFVSKLYSNYSLPRNIVQNLMFDISELMEKPVQVLKKAVDCSSQELSDILNSFDFKNFGSEYKTFQLLETSGTFIKPLSIILGQQMSDVRKKNSITAELIDFTMQYVPIKETLKAFLQLPGVFETLCSYLKYLKGDTAISSIVQAELWREYQLLFYNKCTFPVYLYADDFEIGNPLGSHAGIHKLCGVYFSLACLPPEYASLLENIFLLQLSHSSDVKYYGNSKVYKKIIKDFTSLEADGLQISIGQNMYTVYFKLILILGDNLGLNSILGLNESFNSHYYCRICRISKLEASTCCKENESLLRSSDNYNQDLQNEQFGIKEKCVWHELSNFHLSKNIAVDIMHDVWEGISRYEFGNILYHFIYEKKFFTLQTLNTRIQFYDFSFKNKPPSILKSQIFQKNVIMSAAEMLNFVQNFSLIIGDLIPEGNEVWDLYLTFLDIIEIINSKVVLPEHSDLLKVLIEEHHTLYIQLFGNLKPKFHFLTHYPRLLRKVGPLINISSIRFEAKHRQFKAAAHAVSSRKNIPYTLAIKNQLFFSQRLLAQKGLKADICCGKHNILSTESREFKIFRDYANCTDLDKYVCTTWVIINGTKYTCEQVIVVDSCNFLPIFGKICLVVLAEQHSHVYFVMKKLKTLSFNEHLHSFEVTENEEILLCKEVNNCVGNKPTVIRVVGGKYFIPSYIV